MGKTILLTNDDGIDARGLGVLASAVSDLGNIIIIAPEREQSASSHSLTLRESIRVRGISASKYAVSGTPTDCVLLGIQGILHEPPDLIISGVNHGPNMGEDVTYSGTVAAAIEGTILGVPSMAISSLQRNLENSEEIEKITRKLTITILSKGIPQDTLLNINIPDPAKSPIKGVKITKMGSRAYRNILKPEVSGKGETHFTVNGEKPIWKDDSGTDIAAIRMGYVSLTPLHLDLTNYKAIVEMESWRFEL